MLILSFPCHILDFFFVSPYRSDSASLKVSNAYASFQIELSAEAKAALLEFEERSGSTSRAAAAPGGEEGEEARSLCRGRGRPEEGEQREAAPGPQARSAAQPCGVESLSSVLGACTLRASDSSLSVWVLYLHLP